VVCEKVDVDDRDEQYRPDHRRIIAEAKLKDSPDARDVTPHSRVHEASKKRHIVNPGDKLTRIYPGSNRFRSLKHFHPCSHDMKDGNHTRFPPGFQLENQQDHLKSDGANQKKIVTINDLSDGIPDFRQQDPEQQIATEQTRPCFFEPEDPKLTKEGFQYRTT